MNTGCTSWFLKSQITSEIVTLLQPRIYDLFPPPFFSSTSLFVPYYQVSPILPGVYLLSTGGDDRTTLEVGSILPRLQRPFRVSDYAYNVGIDGHEKGRLSQSPGLFTVDPTEFRETTLRVRPPVVQYNSKWRRDRWDRGGLVGTVVTRSKDTQRTK